MPPSISIPLESSKLRRLQFLAYALLFYTLLVIVWGAWVRISHSGDGCGKSWPLCEGEFIPSQADHKTWIEYTHRLMSGFYGLLVIGLFLWIRKNFFSNKTLRFWSLSVLLLMTSEALLGAKLVLFGLVGTNDTFFRVLIMAFHQLNSFLLMGANLRLALVASVPFEAGGEVVPSPFSKFKTWILGFFLIVAMTGAWASLSNTLYPSEGILQGLMKDFSQDAHPLVRLRTLHPFLASLLCSFVIIYSWIKYLSSPQRRTLVVLLIFLFAFVLGWLTLFTLAPLGMKIAHLLMAHGLWLFFINEVYGSSRRVE